MISLAHELLAWTGLLALSPPIDARRWEPKRLRLRLFSIAATLARRSRQTWLRLSRTAPWTPLLLAGAETDTRRHRPGHQLTAGPARPDDPGGPAPPGLEPAPARPRPSRRTPTPQSAQ